MKFPTIKKLEKAIGIPALDWEGRCHEIAIKVLRTGLVVGESRYGHYHGFISPISSHFGGRTFSHHGWIELPDKRICDPTRWCFEARDPYLYVSPTTNNPDYDFGGNRLRKMMTIHKSVPQFDPDPEMRTCNFSKSPKPVKDFLERTFGRLTLSFNQIIYLGNLPLDEFGGVEFLIYKELIDNKFGATIPMDNRDFVMKKHEDVPKHRTRRKSS